MRAAALSSSSRYPYKGTAYADPDAVTQIANGLSTSTFSYDNNGNLTQKTVDGTSTTYVYDYANRLIALGAGGATTTYGYDALGTRVLQTGTTTTYIYPFKWYSVACSTGSGAKYATTTDYVFNGDTLLATVDQQTASGVATGTAKTRYVHPDHLGSTNIVTDENANVVQTLDSYPYGATRISVATSTNEQRKYVGQFSDQSNLDYLNARYYSPTQGEFLSEDPVFLGQTKQQDLQDPQSLNSYLYAEDNPITKRDPTGLTALRLGLGAVFWNVSIGAGLTIGTTDDGGYSVGPYLDAGAVVGGEVSGPEITTANLPEQYAITTGASASGGSGEYGVEMSKNETYYRVFSRSSG
jgi:RHS repeat-associated protein